MKEAHAIRPDAVRPHQIEVHAIKVPNRSAKVKLATALGAVLTLGMMASSAAAAAGPDISIHLDEVTFASPGTVVALEQASVPAALQGQVCTATYAGANNSSVHPGTELVITSNGDTIVLAGVEEVAGAVTSATDRLTLGPTVIVSVRIGTDGLSSLGASLDLTCAPAGGPDTTPATAVTTVITDPTTTAAATVPTSAASTVPGPSVSATVAVAPPPMVNAATTTLVASGGPVPPAVSTATTSPASTTPATTPGTGTPGTGTAGTLPATGSNTPGWLLGAGGALLLTGLAAMTARRGDRRPV